MDVTSLDIDAYERIRSLERQVSDLRVACGSLTASSSHLSAVVAELSGVVTTLNNTMNQGRGAIWFAMAAVGGAGALLVEFLKSIFEGR